MISQEDVQHVAVLAKLHFTPEEFELFSGHFQNIVEYVEQLSEVDTEGVTPTYHGNDMINVFREDVVIDSHHQAALLANAPKSHNGYIQVPAIMESEEA